MKKYGLKIGNVGVEFVSVEERDKALRAFTKGVDVSIHKQGVKYLDGDGSFSVYDRDTKEVLVSCYECDGTFGIDSCGKREYPHKPSYSKDFSTREEYVCDACMARWVRVKEVFDAQATLNQEEDDE